MNDKKIKENFILYTNLLESFIENEKYIQEDFLITWQKFIKPSINKIKPQNSNIFTSFVNIDDIEKEIQGKKIIEDNNNKENNIKSSKEVLSSLLIKEDIDNNKGPKLLNMNRNMNKFKEKNKDNQYIDIIKEKDEKDDVIIKKLRNKFDLELEDFDLNSSRESSVSFINSRKQLNFIDEKENKSNYIILNGKIKYISIDLFIKKIALENFTNTHSLLVSAFLNQFCSFMDLRMFMNKIITGYNYLSQNYKVQLNSLILFLNNCVIEIYEYFKELKFSDPIYQILKKFYTQLLEDKKIKLNNIEDILSLLEDECPNEQDLRYVKNLIQERKKSKAIVMRNFNRDNNFTLSLKKNIGCKFSVLNYTETEISYQLTYISKTYFNKIEIKEILTTKFTKQNKEKDSPNIIKLINNSNNLTNFIIEEILSESKIEKRAKIIEQWIKICDSCRKIKNYNDCVPIQFALSNYFISNLDNTWRYVKKEYTSMLVDLKNFCSPNENFRKLRDSIKNCKNCAYIPFLGIFLRDISHYEERFKYIKNEKLIDFHKILLVENIIEDFFKFKYFAFNINPIDTLDFFNNIKCKNEEELDELFQKVEKK